MKYKRYIGNGKNAFQCLQFCKLNRLAYSKKIDKHDITSRTKIVNMEVLQNENASSMEKMLLFAYFYHSKNGKNFSESEYKYFKKFIIAFGKKNLYEIFENFASKTSCVGIKEDETHYRIIYFSK